MSSRLLQADYVLSSSLKLEVSKSLRADKLINTEPSRTGWWKVGGKREKDRKGGRKVVGKSRAQPHNFLKYLRALSPAHTHSTSGVVYLCRAEAPRLFRIGKHKGALWAAKVKGGTRRIVLN